MPEVAGHVALQAAEKSFCQCDLLLPLGVYASLIKQPCHCPTRPCSLAATSRRSSPRSQLEVWAFTPQSTVRHKGKGMGGRDSGRTRITCMLCGLVPQRVAPQPHSQIGHDQHHVKDSAFSDMLGLLHVARPCFVVPTLQALSCLPPLHPAPAPPQHRIHTLTANDLY